ncbi:hypothetical protein P0F17_000569 [Vibrio metschnikovii]|nr:hypothetical protein [Vibrio metschnikovii]
MKQIIRNVKETANSPSHYDCEYLHPNLGWIPFLASELDVEPHGLLIHRLILMGDFEGEIEAYVQDYRSQFEEQRNQLLERSKLSNVEYDELTGAQQEELLAYRETLKAMSYNDDVIDFPPVPDFLS